MRESAVTHSEVLMRMLMHVWKLPTHTKIRTNTKKHTTNDDFWGNHGKRYAAAQAQIRRSACFLQLHLVICVCARANVWEGCKRLCVWICLVQYYIYTNTHNTHTRGEGAREGASEREREVKKNAPEGIQKRSSTHNVM